MFLIHLVSSLSTAGSLTWNIHQHLLPGEVCCITDDPGLGPSSEWQALQEKCDRDKVDRIVLWIGDTGSDYVFERMACYWLKNIPVSIFKVNVPPVNGHYTTAAHTPESLAGLFSATVLITNAERKTLSKAFEKIAADPAPLRELDADGQLQFREISVHDDLILSNINGEWQLAAGVVGNAMEQADARNPLGDAFLASRLNYLITQGKIESDGPRTALQSFRIRKK